MPLVSNKETSLLRAWVGKVSESRVIKLQENRSHLLVLRLQKGPTFLGFPQAVFEVLPSHLLGSASLAVPSSALLMSPLLLLERVDGGHSRSNYVTKNSSRSLTESTCTDDKSERRS